MSMDLDLNRRPNAMLSMNNPMPFMPSGGMPQGQQPRSMGIPPNQGAPPQMAMHPPGMNNSPGMQPGRYPMHQVPQPPNVMQRQQPGQQPMQRPPNLGHMNGMNMGMGGVGGQAMAVPSNMMGQSVRRAVSAGGAPPHMPGMNMGMNPQAPGHMRQPFQGQQGQPMPQPGQQPQQPPRMEDPGMLINRPMAMNRATGMPPQNAQRPPMQPMSSLQQPPNMDQGGMPPPQGPFASPLPPHHMSSSPRPQTHTPGMPAQVRPPMGPDGVPYNFPNHQLQTSPPLVNRMQGNPGRPPFVPSSSPHGPDVQGGGPGTQFHPTPAQQFEQMQTLQNGENFPFHVQGPHPHPHPHPPTANGPPRPPSHPQNPHHHQSPPGSNDPVPYPTRPQSQPQPRPPSQSGGPRAPGQFNNTNGMVPPSQQQPGRMQPTPVPPPPQQPPQTQMAPPPPRVAPQTPTSTPHTSPPAKTSPDSAAVAAAGNGNANGAGGQSSAAGSSKNPTTSISAVGHGQGVMRALQFSGILANEMQKKWTLRYWKEVIEEYFTPKAQLRIALWKDNQRTEAKLFEVSEQILPRFFLVTTQSGVKGMTLTLDGARERVYAPGHSVVECVNATWTFKYTSGWTVALRGPLTIHVIIVALPPGMTGGVLVNGSAANYTLKFDDFQFDANTHEKCISIDAVIGPRSSADVPRALPGAGEQEDEDKKWDEPRIFFEQCYIPGEPVNAFGIPQATMRCLELAESVGQMGDLIAYASSKEMGPLDALTEYAGVLREKHGPLPSSIQTAPIPNSLPNYESGPQPPAMFGQSSSMMNPPAMGPQPSASTSTASPQHRPASASASPRKQNKTIPQQQQQQQQQANAPTPSAGSASAQSTPAMANATLKRKAAGESNAGDQAQQPPGKRAARKRGKSSAAG